MIPFHLPIIHSPQAFDWDYNRTVVKFKRTCRLASYLQIRALLARNRFCVLLAWEYGSRFFSTGSLWIDELSSPDGVFFRVKSRQNGYSLFRPHSRIYKRPQENYPFNFRIHQAPSIKIWGEICILSTQVWYFIVFVEETLANSVGVMVGARRYNRQLTRILSSWAMLN